MKRSSVFVLFLGFLAFSCDPNEGKKVESFDSDGKLSVVAYLDDNETKDTLSKVEYYPNGTKKTEGTYKNNLRHGKWSYWYENGKLWSEGSFVDGISDGTFRNYNEDGSLFIEKNYKMGKMEGKTTIFDKGKKVKEVFYSGDSIVNVLNF